MLPATIAGMDAIFAVRIQVVGGSAEVAATKLFERCFGHALRLTPGPWSRQLST